MVAPGVQTSEHKRSTVATVINVFLALAGGVLTYLNPDTPWYAVIAALVAGANSWMSSVYTKSRTALKIAEVSSPLSKG